MRKTLVLELWLRDADFPDPDNGTVWERHPDRRIYRIDFESSEVNDEYLSQTKVFLRYTTQKMTRSMTSNPQKPQLFILAGSNGTGRYAFALEPRLILRLKRGGGGESVRDIPQRVRKSVAVSLPEDPVF